MVVSMAIVGESVGPTPTVLGSQPILKGLIMHIMPVNSSATLGRVLEAVPPEPSVGLGGISEESTTTVLGVNYLAWEAQCTGAANGSEVKEWGFGYGAENCMESVCPC